MSPRPLRRARALLVAGGGLVVHLVATATPAGAHSGGAGGSLPAPSWLLAYIGAFAVGCTALALRSSWGSARWWSLSGDTVQLQLRSSRRSEPGILRVGQTIGTLVFAAVVCIALRGPADEGTNLAPYAVFVIFWVGLPVLCLVAGDVLRSCNPFLVPFDLAQRLRGERETGAARAAPSWAGAALLFAFSWFWLAYHRAGSPRMLAVLLLAYVAAAILGGLVWGRTWLEEGEGFAALSRGVSQISPFRRNPAPIGLLPVVAVWVGGTLYDAVSSTEFWLDVQGTTTEWSRTAINTVGMVWMIAVVGVIALAIARVAAPADDRDGVAPTALPTVLGVALVPIALAWFVAHDLTFFLFESQNFWALLSDPLGEGWDLFGTIDHRPSYSFFTARWVRWVQLAVLLGGHLLAVVLAHDAALTVLGRRRGMRATWAVAAGVTVSIVGAALLVLR